MELAQRVSGLLERLERGEQDELRREKFWELRALIVDDLAARATSRADFMRFLDALRADLKAELARPEAEVAWGAGERSHPDLEGFLESLEAWLRASPSGRLDALDSYAWQALADMMLAARGYE